MSGIKRVIEDDEAKRADALQFALELGVLQRCAYHNIVFEDSGDLEGAYRAAAAHCDGNAVHDATAGLSDIPSASW